MQAKEKPSKKGGKGKGKGKDNTDTDVIRVSDLEVKRNHKKLWEATLKMLLSHAQMLAMVVAIVVDGYEIAVDSHVFKVLKIEGRKYHDKIEELGRKPSEHQLGPPHLHLAGGLFDYLGSKAMMTKHGATLGPAVQQMSEIYSDMDQSEAYLTVRCCRLMRLWSGDRKKLLLAISDSGPMMFRMVQATASTPASKEQGKPSPRCLRNDIRMLLEAEGHRHFVGPPPPGALEDVLQRALRGDD